MFFASPGGFQTRFFQKKIGELRCSYLKGACLKSSGNPFKSCSLAIGKGVRRGRDQPTAPKYPWSPYFLGNFLDAISLYVIKGKHDALFFRKRVDELF